MTTKTGAVTVEELAVPFAPPANNASFANAGPRLDGLRGDAVGGVVAAFEAVLDNLRAPALVLSRSGEVVLMSRAARAMGESELERMLRPLAGRTSQAPADREWELRAIENEGRVSGFIAVLRSRPRTQVHRGLHAKAKRRWKLTPRQEQVLGLIARGHTNALVAETLGIAESTVEFHLTAVFDKAGVCNRATLLAELFRLRDE